MLPTETQIYTDIFNTVIVPPYQIVWISSKSQLFVSCIMQMKYPFVSKINDDIFDDRETENLSNLQHLD
jgi:hypothetical protein